MFQIIINLLLTSFFLQAQAMAPGSLLLPANNLPQAEDRPAIKMMPQRDFSKASLGVKVTAQSFLVIEPESGAILYEQNSKDVRSIASITKLMTALVFLEHNPGWNNDFTISKDDYRSGGTVYFNAGDIVTIKDVFYVTLVASSNEGAVALARSTGLSVDQFVAEMNKKAKQMGMTSSHFADPTGLNSANKSNAEDIIRMAKEVFSHPEIKKAVSSKEYSFAIKNSNITRRAESTDKILGKNFGVGANNYTLEAGKTGYIEMAGYCLTSEIQDKNNRKLLIAVLGSSSTNDRFLDTKSLAYWAFNNYKW
ncbi:MAG: serine hydrolase [Patescibacteria group bacterium]